MEPTASFDFQKSLREVQISTLSNQTSIYTSCLLPCDSKLGPNRLLLSPVVRDFKIYSYSRPNGFEIEEKLFAYVPEENDIMAVKSFTPHDIPSELVTGNFCYIDPNFLQIFDIL